MNNYAIMNYSFYYKNYIVSLQIHELYCKDIFNKKGVCEDDICHISSW